MSKEIKGAAQLYDKNGTCPTPKTKTKTNICFYSNQYIIYLLICKTNTVFKMIRFENSHSCSYHINEYIYMYELYAKIKT